MSETLFEYYKDQEVLPTFGGFQTSADLENHTRERHRLFYERLYLPTRVFRGARLLEFGPDAGENSLVFAAWGADCTLAEPNLKAHPVIKDYFDKFKLRDRLVELNSWDVLNYPEPVRAKDKFDLVDAEGFIYTVQPTSRWATKLSRLLRDDGLAVLFYCEAYGCFFELLLKVVQAQFRRITGKGSLESARALFRAKWDSIPHKRRIESWTMDVLENPFVRLKYFLEPQALCTEMAAAGFQLYSSWPRYDDGLDLFWFKRPVSPEEQLQKQKDFISRNRLSHLFGRKHFLVRSEPELEADLWTLLERVDSLVDSFNDSLARECDEQLARLERILQSDDVLSSPNDLKASLETISATRRLFPVLASGSAEDILSFCNRESAFINCWGMPAQFAVFRKLPGA